MSRVDTNLLGRWGEALVAEDLRRKGYRILAAGYRTRFGEIDLIASTGQYLIFTEVKLRKNNCFASAREAVGPAKQRRLRASAELWLSEHGTGGLQPRFDVAEVYAPEGMSTRHPSIEYIENAF